MASRNGVRTCLPRVALLLAAATLCSAQGEAQVEAERSISALCYDHRGGQAHTQQQDAVMHSQERALEPSHPPPRQLLLL